jgi:FKBP-type peptidyl-prolyl cis-trans isomerase FklB
MTKTIVAALWLGVAAGAWAGNGGMFFADNAKRADVVTLSDGLQYRVLGKGTGRSADSAGQVVLNYRGTLLNGNEFATTYDREHRAVPRSFFVAKLIPGLREAVERMREGDRWQVFIPPQLGVRRGGGALELRPVIFDVELVEVRAPG